MIPNCAGTVRSPDGSPYCARLKTLKISQRHSTAVFSPALKRFARATSSCASDGPLARFRPAFPTVPETGTRNVAGLIHCDVVRPPAGIRETPGTTSGLCEAVYPPGTSAAERRIVIFTGFPLRIVAIPLNDHPPKMVRSAPGSFKLG